MTKVHNLIVFGIIPIVFNMCACSGGILPGNFDLFFTKTPGWEKWIPAFAAMTVWRKR